MLTAKQEAILNFIQQYLDEHQYPPSVREIGAHFKIYPATVQDHISALERKGYLQKRRFQSRSLTLPASARRNGVPIVGRVAAGRPLLAAENIEDVVLLPDPWTPPGAFLLRVQGDSMTGAHILDGDYVMVHPKGTVQNGDIVVAMIGEEATVKRFMKTASGITLQAENPRFAPIEVPVSEAEEFRVLGKVVGVLRLLKERKKNREV